MRIHLILNLAVVFLLLGSGFSAVVDAVGKINKFGWQYDKLVTIGGTTNKVTVNCVEQLLSATLILFIALFSVGYTTVKLAPFREVTEHVLDETGLEFTSSATPSKWAVDIIIPEHRLEVHMDQYSLSIPFKLIEGGNVE